jgi:hypothetical protein
MRKIIFDTLEERNFMSCPGRKLKETNTRRRKFLKITICLIKMEYFLSTGKILLNEKQQQTKDRWVEKHREVSE